MSAPDLEKPEEPQEFLEWPAPKTIRVGRVYTDEQLTAIRAEAFEEGRKRERERQRKIVAKWTEVLLDVVDPEAFDAALKAVRALPIDSGEQA